MRYYNTRTGESFDEPEDCFDSVKRHLDEGVRDMLAGIGKEIERNGGDPDRRKVLEYIEGAMEYLDAGIEDADEDAEALVWNHVQEINV